MRLLPSPAPTAAAKTEFRIPLSPQAALPAPLPSAKCHVDKCPWWPYSNSRDFKANTALVIVFLFCTLVCGLACNSAIRYLCTRWCRRRRTPDDQKADLGCASAEKETEISAVIYSEGMRLAGADAECAICLSEFAIGERIRVLEKCSHGFHVECIGRWLASHSSCPTCRAHSE